MLGSEGGCSGPLSWWCSEVLRCSPKVAPNPGTPSTSAPMAECEHCGLKFNFLRRRRECVSCRMVYCGSCLKQVGDGRRWCNKCLVLAQWPLDMTKVTALRVKDLRQYLHSRHINTATCTEKSELIDLVTRHISSQRRSTVTQQPTAAPQHATTHAPGRQGRHRPAPRAPVVPQDDGIRVRPNSNSSMGSIRVRPVDSIRVKPGQPASPDARNPDADSDQGIRVFPSERGGSSQDTSSTTSPTSPGSYPGHPGRGCSRCPSNNLTASCSSLECCHDGMSGYPHDCSHHIDTSSQNSEEWVFVPEQAPPSAPPVDEVLIEDRMSTNASPCPPAAGVMGMSTEESSGPPQPPSPDQEEDHPSPPPPTTSSSSSASSSAPTSAVSSPEPTKGILAGIVALKDLKSEEEIHQLTVKQCKELLSLHRVNYSGVCEKSELFSKIKILWEDYRNSRQEMENLPEELLCKICMDNVIDCVLLECGHMVSCIQCGKQMSECPMCRQYVVRVVRTFRA